MKHLFILIFICVIVFVLSAVACRLFRQSTITASPGDPASTGYINLAATGEDVASNIYLSQSASIEAISEKPAPPPGLPLERLGVICDVQHDKNKCVALTFDDGPSPEMTPEYLRVLREKGVHATFFLIGRQVQRAPGLAAMIADSGNEIGNHTYSHLNLKKSPLADDIKDILNGQNVIEQETHRKPTLLRPPGGELDVPVIKVIQKLGYTIVFWNIDPHDWQNGATPEAIVDNVITNLRPGSIILLHEGKLPTLEALPQLIDEIRRQGYQIDTVSELLAPIQRIPPMTTVANKTGMTSQKPSGGAG